MAKRFLIRNPRQLILSFIEGLRRPRKALNQDAFFKEALSKGSIVLPFFLPVALWFYLFNAQLAGRAVVGTETFTIFSTVKFFLDNFRQGIFPLWDPFLMLGHSAQVLLAYMGATNPLWLLMLALNACGVSLYIAFVWTIVFYFWCGAAGFYLLCRELLRSHPSPIPSDGSDKAVGGKIGLDMSSKDREAAYLAFVLFLFSSYSFMPFPQYHPVFLFVPGVWFFYFLLRFREKQQTRDVVGLCFSSILVVSGYLPFYFLTILLSVIFLSAIFCPREIGATVKEFGRYAVRHKFISLFLVGVFVVALVPGILAFRALSTHQLVAPMRGYGDDIFERGARITATNFSSDGDLSARILLDELWANLDHIQYGNAGFFYVAIFAYLVFFITGFNRTSKTTLFFLVWCSGLFLFLMGNATPLHQLLYEHIGYFRLFRNQFFLLPYLLAGFVLLIAELYRLFIRSEPLSPSGRRLRLVWLGGVHLAAGIFLSKQDNVPGWSFVALCLSWFYWHQQFRQPRGIPDGWLKWVLLAAVLVQPAFVIRQYNKQEDRENEFIRQAVSVPPTKAEFLYVRPLTRPAELPIANSHLHNSWSRLAMKDAAIFDTQDFLAYWTYYLRRKIPEEEFRSYWQQKFLVYDRVRIVDERQNALSAVLGDFRQRPAYALISRDWQDLAKGDLADLLTSDEGTTGPLVVTGLGENLLVKKFTVNTLTLETNFPSAKMLVYNDSFDVAWQAFVNGTPVPLYRANMAFKGVKLPAGRNIVQFRFHPWGGERLYFFVLASNLAVLLMLGVLFFREARKKPVVSDLSPCSIIFRGKGT